MYLSLRGDNLIERIGLFLGLVPPPLVQVSLGSGYLKSIVAGARLGIYEALQENDASAEELAERISCSLTGTTALANALAGADVLKRVRGRYSLTRSAQKWLLKDTPSSLLDGVLFIGRCTELLDGMEEGIRSGQVVRLHDMEHPPEFWQSYVGALASFARMMRGSVLRKLKLKSPRRILDVGGGHGLYAAAACRKFAGCEAVVIDLPEAAASGRSFVERDGMSEFVTFQDDDFRTADWGTDFDVVFLFHVLHNATQDEAQLLLRNAYEALKPGGQLAIYDASHDGGDGNIDMSSGWNELFFFFISGAQVWPERQLRTWAEDIGFEGYRSGKLLGAPEFVASLRKPTLGS